MLGIQIYTYTHVQDISLSLGVFGGRILPVGPWHSVRFPKNSSENTSYYDFNIVSENVE